MSKTYLNYHHLELDFWNRGGIVKLGNTFHDISRNVAKKVKVTPKKNIYRNYKGGKIKELSRNKIYDAIEATVHREGEAVYFFGYVILTDNGEVVKYEEKNLFLDISSIRDKKINQILGD